MDRYESDMSKSWAIVRAGGLGPVEVLGTSERGIEIVIRSIPEPESGQHRLVPQDQLGFVKDFGSLTVWVPILEKSTWLEGIADGLVGVGNLQVAVSRGVVTVPEHNVWIKPVRQGVDVAGMVRLKMTSLRKEMKARRKFRHWLTEQEALSVGLSSFWQTPIRPVRHQFGVALRVLNDPVRRYLLADEVGLGKTIEAGLIVKELFREDPQTRVVVVVPEALAQQWTDEMINKVRVGTEIATGLVRVLPHERLNEATDADLVIIDEAHRLTTSRSAGDGTYRALVDVCHGTPSVLLLSATPMRSGASDLLRMLHLVDPETYALAGEESFTKQLQQRSAQAGIVQFMSQDYPLELIRALLPELVRSLPGDQIAEDLVSEIEDTNREEANAYAAAEALGELVRERYRISRRMIRTRRTDEVDSQLPPAGRKAGALEISDPLRKVVDEFFEEWRDRARMACSSGDNEGSAPDLQLEVFREVIEGVLGGATPVRAWIGRRRQELSDKKASPAFLGELSFLDNWSARMKSDIPGADERLEVLVTCLDSDLFRQGRKTVLAVASKERATRMYEILKGRIGGHRVVAFHAGMTAEDRESSIQAFNEADEARFLVLDQMGEEGLNLQTGRRIINVDIPWSLNRLEQRLGRLDRFAPGYFDEAECILLEEPDSQLVSQVHDLIRNAVGLLDRSVASVQRELTRLENELTETLLESGPIALGVLHESIREQLDTERREVESLEYLEATDSGADVGHEVVEGLTGYIEQWTNSQREFDFITSSDGGVGITRYVATDTPKLLGYTIPRQGCLVPSMLQRYVALRLPKSATTNRAVAETRPKVELLSIGHPFVSWIDSYIGFEDRGRVEFRRYVDPTVMDARVRVEAEFTVRSVLGPGQNGLTDGEAVRFGRRIAPVLPSQQFIVTVDIDGNATGPLSEWDGASGGTPIDGKDLLACLELLPSWQGVWEHLENSIYEQSNRQLEEQSARAIGLLEKELAARVAILRRFGRLDEADRELGVTEAVVAQLAEYRPQLESVAVGILYGGDL